MVRRSVGSRKSGQAAAPPAVRSGGLMAQKKGGPKPASPLAPVAGRDTDRGTPAVGEDLAGIHLPPDLPGVPEAAVRSSLQNRLREALCLTRRGWQRSCSR